MLLADNSSAELSDVDATNLIRLLSASVKKAVGERIVPATDNRKLYHNKAQRVIESLHVAFSSQCFYFLLNIILGPVLST